MWGSGPILIHGQMGEERLNFGAAPLVRMGLTVKENIAFNPADMGLFSADGVVLASDGVTNLIEQLPGALFYCSTSWKLLLS